MNFVMTPAVEWLERGDPSPWGDRYSPAISPNPLNIVFFSIKRDHEEADPESGCSWCGTGEYGEHVKPDHELIVIEPEWQPSPAVEWLERCYDRELRLHNPALEGRLVAAAAPWRHRIVQPMVMLKSDKYASPMVYRRGG